jgi:tetratricopeptide (TPR) repeat protein
MGIDATVADCRSYHASKPRFHLVFTVLTILAAILAGVARSPAQGTPGPMIIPNAQSPQTPMGPGAPGTPASARSGVTIRVTILDENKKALKQQSLIRLTNHATGRVLFQTTRGPDATFSDAPTGKFLLEVGAAGYLATHIEIDIPDIDHDLTQTVILTRDPAAVDLSLKDAAEFPSKVRKEVQKGVQALELSDLAEAGKHLEVANREYPASPSIHFLLGYLALQQKDPDRELAHLSAAAKLDPHNLQAQNLLGQLYYQRGDYTNAAEAAQIVVASSGESVVARKILANSCLQLKQYEKARDNAQRIVDHGGSEAVSAQLVLGQALAGLQQNEAALQTLKTYLDEAPASSVTPQVRELVARLEHAVSQGGAENVQLPTGVRDPELAAEGEVGPGNGGMPFDVDAQKPAVAAGVQCPANLLDWTANPSRDLVSSVAQFSAVEHMVHEKLSPRGTPSNRETRQYNYVAAISEPAPDTLIIQEYRDSGDLEMPDKITTTGLPVLAIAFHPHFRDDFEMRCEGLGDWNGQAAWLVHFRQLDEKPPRLRVYVVNGSYYPVALKGRAWIRADNFQITHLETDLVRPIPEIRLLSEHTSVSYGPVEFKRSHTDLWLPQSADLYVHYAKLRFHRSERFDHFMLFATQATDTAKLPKGGGPSQSSDAGHGAAQPQ